jgi:hypothetical protein
MPPYDPAMYGAPRPPKKSPRNKLIFAFVFLGVGLMLCLFGSCVAAVSGSNDDDRAAQIVSPSQTFSALPAEQQATTPAPSKPIESSAPKKPAPTIAGDDLVHVGEDVPAGTYRAAESVDGDCYWKKSTDPEGDDIIDNDFPPGGRPQVTLKKGQWFTSARCPEWRKK